MNTALEEVRAGESRRIAQTGFEPVLKNTRGCLLKRKENLTDKQRFRLRDLMRYNLKTVRAYLLEEEFQQFWDYARRLGPAGSSRNGAVRPCVPASNQ